MTYTDAAAVTVKLSDVLGNTGSIEGSTMADALQSADDIINSELDAREIPYPETTPDSLIRAATYYAATDILDSMNKMNQHRNPTAQVWDDKASKLVNNYIKQYLNSHAESDSPQSYHHGLSDKHRAFRGYGGSRPRDRWY